MGHAWEYVLHVALFLFNTSYFLMYIHCRNRSVVVRLVNETGITLYRNPEGCSYNTSEYIT